jgi:hypothetical protein
MTLTPLTKTLARTILSLGILGACTPSDPDPTPNPGSGGRGGAGASKGGASGSPGGSGGSTPTGTGGAAVGTGGAVGGGTGGSGPGGSGGSGTDAPPSSTDGGKPPEAEGTVPTDLTKHKFSKAIRLDTTAAGANVPAAVAKFPVAVQLNAMNFDFAQAKSAGEDIRFALPDGTLLPYSIELWDGAGKQAAVWVKVDVKGNDATQSIVMHWGNPDAQSASSSRSVFNMEDGFVGVWHLDEDGSNAPEHYKDSSTNGAHLTAFNMEPGTSVAARVGKGTLFTNPGGQGKNQWMGVEGPKVEPLYNASAARPITASGWAYGNSFSGYYETIFSKGDTSWTLQRDYQGRMETCTWSGSYHACAITGAPPVKKWVHYMIVQTQSNLTLFVDGKRAAGTGSFGKVGVHGFAIGHNYQANNNAATGKREWDGMFDEVRVMTGGKDVNWALLDFQSQREGSTFLKFGETVTK